MKHPRSKASGFTLTEMIVALSIMILIGAMGIGVFYSSKKTKTLDVITDGLNFTMELARSDALTGKGGSNFGIFVATSSYTYFMGSFYVDGSASNRTTAIPSGWLLSTSTGNGSSAIVFLRLLGTPQAMATVTVSNIGDPSLTRSLVVGSQGNISVK